MAQFKISTNIERDAALELDYIVTRNSNDVYNRIIHNYKNGQKSFSIIGSYGTGKSSFLWAFEQHLNGKVKFDSPVNGEFKGVKDFVFERIVGDSYSFKKCFCDKFGLSKLANEPNKNVLKEFDALYNEITSGTNVLVLLVDEFGKHLEYIAKNAPEEMYFIQELAEYCNNPNKKILFVNTLHQNFSVYSKGLSKAEKSEWDKVKGRLLDVAFDEPVEQLLFFASSKLSEYQVPKSSDAAYTKLVKCSMSSGLLGKSLNDSESTLRKLYPLDPISADILTKCLQRYGQNERSLFTFLESPELGECISEKTIFNVADCFDYLTQNLSSEIEDAEKNPFKPQWKAAILAIEKAEFLFEDNFNEAAKLIKTICLVNIFSNAAGVLNDDVIDVYGSVSLGIKNPNAILTKLVSNKVVKYSNHRNKYNFIDGTDVDIEHELINAGKHIENDFKLINRLKSIFDLNIVPAKRAQFKSGTPRFFAYNFWDEIDYEEPEGEIDGFINLIFTNKRIKKELIERSAELPSSQVFVLFKEVDKIEQTIFEIDKINYVIKSHSDDKVALRILNEEKLFRVNQIESFVLGALFSKESKVSWIWNGKEREGKGQVISSEKALNKFLSEEVCLKTYPSTPVYRNEMVNKELLSTPILSARKSLIKRMLEFGATPDLGFPNDKFPPEKTIYLSLLKNTGIHCEVEEGVYGYSKPSDTSFDALWEKSNEILADSVHSKLCVTEFYSRLKQVPFKLKSGFLHYWVPIFLIIKKEDYSLYSADGEYIPYLDSDVLDVIHKNPKKYFVKALSTEGVNGSYLNLYKELVSFDNSKIKGLVSSYGTVYSNFLRFCRDLPWYTLNTKQLSKEAISFREAILKAKDPESSLFEKIPVALGFHKIDSEADLKMFADKIQEVIRSLREAFDRLIEIVEDEVVDHIDDGIDSFEDLKAALVKRYSGINANILVDRRLKIFHARLISPLNDKASYWNTICDALLNKEMDKISDQEVGVFVSRLKSSLELLDDLLELHQIETKDGEDVFQVNIINSGGSIDVKKNLIVSDKQVGEVDAQVDKLSKILGDDAEINKIALLKLLEQQLKKDGKS